MNKQNQQWTIISDFIHYIHWVKPKGFNTGNFILRVNKAKYNAMLRFLEKYNLHYEQFGIKILESQDVYLF